MNRRELVNKINSGLIKIIAITAIVVLTGLFIFIINESLPALSNVGADIFTSEYWYPTDEPPEFGMVALIFGSLALTGLSSVMVLPLGYIVAFFMYDYARDSEFKFIKSAVDLLSGVPSVIVGTFLLIFVSPIFLKLGAYAGENLLLASIGLTILSLPYTASLMFESMNSVDQKLKESALALGATRFTAGFKVVSKKALPGIINSAILTVNRVIGETMVVTMVAGGAAMIPRTLFDPVRPLTAVIASEMGEVELGSLHYSALFVAGFILLTISFTLTLVAKRFSRGEHS